MARQGVVAGDVSGFFGSGKSHLLKMLCHLWQDTGFPDGATARSLVPSIPEDLRALLRELDTAGKRAGGLIAAAGALPSGTTDNVRLTILAILLRAVGLPEQYPQARFCLWLHSQGQFDRVKAAVEAAGKAFERELNNLYVSGPIARAVMESDKNFAFSEAEAKQLLKAQFPPQVTDITTEQFLLVAKDALKLKAKDGRLPCTLLILDEAQQYIGDSQQRASLLTEVGEQLDGGNIAVRRMRGSDIPIAGTRLIREYQGVEHTVTVMADGYEWQGRPYKSLSAIARAITGTRWNGLLFFGLKNRRAAA